jgi:prepilin-type N-terminal cleavage/methylation domain-containing protein
MKKFLQSVHKDNKGFTIIETLIVMALAGLMIAAVVVAVPQLQRNQRNSVRRDILGRVKAEVDGFSANNSGALPVRAAANTAGNFGSSTADTNAFVGRYLSGVNINDPSTGVTVTFDVANVITTLPSQGQIKYFLGAECGIDGSMTAQAGRKYAISIGLEGGSTYCLDNK